jgi:hypothetical protein
MWASAAALVALSDLELAREVATGDRACHLGRVGRLTAEQADHRAADEPAHGQAEQGGERDHAQAAGHGGLAVADGPGAQRAGLLRDFLGRLVEQLRGRAVDALHRRVALVGREVHALESLEALAVLAAHVGVRLDEAADQLLGLGVGHALVQACGEGGDLLLLLLGTPTSA